MGLFRSSRRQEAQRLAAAAAPARSFLRRLPWEIRLLLLAPIYVGLPALCVIAAALVYYTALIPNPMALRVKERTPIIRVLARDGSVLAERGGAGEYVPIDLLPRHLLNAVLATEDRRFFEHWGLDPAGLARAVLANVQAGRVAQGGSTLTQQLAKNLFLTSERTLTRKLEEMILALWLEARLSKRDILELYLNRVYFGAGAYGVQAAAHRFFNKPAQEITLAEAAILAGLLKAPSRYSPAWNPVTARLRARNVLSKMADAGLLSARESSEAMQATVNFSTLAQRGDAFDYAVDAVLEKLPELIGSPVDDVIVETTLDRNLQQRAQSIVHELLLSDGRKGGADQAGLLLLDMDGGMRAVVGGRSYAESQFNRALKAKRQPGSTFKPFVYLAAVESGLQPDSIVQDLPILGAGWSPRNEGGYRGAVTLREALAQSMNAATVRLHLSVGPRATARVAHRLGIRSALREDASLALGTSEVTLLELTAAYGVLAHGGRALEPYIVTRIRTGSGQLLYQQPRRTEKVLVAKPYVAALNDMLSAVLVYGTGRRAALANHPAAGKTGTSQDFRDAWFVGYTAEYVAGVWVGNDDGRPMHKVMGGSLPARLWHDVMTVAYGGEGSTASAPASVTSLVASASAQEPQTATRLPRLPAENIDPAFVERAIQRGGAGSDETPRQNWLSMTVSQLKHGLGF